MICRTSARAALIVCLATGLSSAASAKTGSGVTFPDTLQAGGRTLVLNGIGKRVVAFVIDGYASALYVPQVAHTEAAILAEPGPKALYTRFLHDASVAQTQKEYRSIYNDYCSDNPCTAQSRATFQKVLDTVTPIKAGETSLYVMDDGTLTISKDDKPVLTVHDPHYVQGVLSSLLGAASPTASYRKGLLGAD